MAENGEKLEITTFEDCAKIIKIFGSWWEVPISIQSKLEEFVESVEITTFEDCAKIIKIFGNFWGAPISIRSKLEEFVESVEITTFEDYEKAEKIFGYDIPDALKLKLETMEITSLEDCIKIEKIYNNDIDEMSEELITKMQEYLGQIKTLEPSRFSSIGELLCTYEIMYKDNLPDGLLKQMKEISEQFQEKIHRGIPASVLFADKKDKLQYLEKKRNAPNYTDICEILLKYTLAEDRDEIVDIVIDKIGTYSKARIIGLCSAEYIEKCIENENLGLSENDISQLIKVIAQKNEIDRVEKLVKKFLDKYNDSTTYDLFSEEPLLPKDPLLLGEQTIEELLSLCSTEYIEECIKNRKGSLNSWNFYSIIQKVTETKMVGDIEKLVKAFIARFPQNSIIEDITSLISFCSIECIESYIKDESLNLNENDVYHLIATVSKSKSDDEVKRLVEIFIDKFPGTSYKESIIGLCSMKYIEQYINDQKINLNDEDFEKLLLDMIYKGSDEKRNDIIKKYIHEVSSKGTIKIMLKELTDYQYAIDYLRENKADGIDIREIIFHYFTEHTSEMMAMSKTMDLTERDEVVEAILYSEMQIERGYINEKINTLKILIGEDKFETVLEGKLGSLNNLLELMKNADPAKVVKAFDIGFINGIGGIDVYVEFIKNSANNKNFPSIVNIIESDKTKEFLEFYDFITTIISVSGVKKFEYLTKISKFYNQNESFCSELKSKELSAEVKNNTLMLFAGDVEEIKDLNFERMLAMFEDKMEEELDAHSSFAIQDSIFRYLMGYGKKEVEDIIKRYMSVSRAIRTRERAEKKGDIALIQEAKLFEIIFEIIEQINSCEDIEKLRDIIEKIHGMAPEKTLELRVQLRGIKEKIRAIYEHNAQSELTDISKMLPKNVAKNTVPVIDLSKKEYLIYMHSTDRSPKNFVAESLRRNTNICVSPNSDEHLAFYSRGLDIVIGFTMLPNGAFIGSRPVNMGSNGTIEYNDFDIEKVSALFDQQPVRDSFDINTEHGETILFTYGLLPSCIVMRDPTDEEQVRKEEIYAKELQELIRESIRSRIYEGMPEEEKQAILREADSFVIPLVKTQKIHERVVNYDISEEKTQGKVDENGEKNEELDMFSRLKDLLIGEQDVIEEADDKCVYKGKIYSKSQKPALTKAIQKLQDIIYNDQEESRLRTIEVNGEFLVEMPQSKASLEGYTKNSGEFAKKTYEGLLMEFLIDHLIANYLPSNDSFSINSNGTIYRLKSKEFASSGDSTFGTGAQYTQMTYYRFDSRRGNNLYRKMFEQHIEKGIFTSEDWDKLEEIAQKISNIPNEEYIAIFEEYMNVLWNDELLACVMKPDAISLLKSRKEHIVEDVKEFRVRVENLRKEKEEITEFEDGSKIAFINDIHGNFEALKSLIESLEQKGKTDIFILGDIIGFGAQSNECLDYIRKKEQEGLRIKCLLGNHELYVLMGNSSNGAPERDKKEVEMDMREISPENRRYMEGMLLTKKIRIHGKLIELTHFPQEKNYVYDKDLYISHDIDFYNIRTDADYMVFGHEHLIENTSEVIQPKVNGKFINLPSSGCVHGTQATYTEVEVDQKGALIFTTHGVDYDWEKNSKELKDKRPNRSEFYYTK